MLMSPETYSHEANASDLKLVCHRLLTTEVKMTCIRRVSILTLAEISIGLSGALCQSPPSETFDAVAVKRWNMERVMSGVQVRGERLDAGAVTLRDLIADAYGVSEQWITGTSDWMETERYNLQATAGRPATRSEFRTMLQNTLADRFHLIIHHEPKRMKAYALVVDKGGPKLTPTNEAFHFTKPPPGQDFIELASTIPQLLSRMNTGHDQQVIGRPVVDRTGLAGQYHIALRAETQWVPGGGLKFDIDYFSALRELGLRLEPIEETFDRIVVESATRPTPN